MPLFYTEVWFYLALCILEFGILITSTDHGTRFYYGFVYWNGILFTYSYCGIWYFYWFILWISIVSSMLWYSFRSRAFSREWIKQLVVEILSIVYWMKKESSNLLLSFGLSIDCRVVDPQLIICLHYWWETSFLLSHMYEFCSLLMVRAIIA